MPVTALTPLQPEAKPGRDREVRFRTVGDMSCTCPVESAAASAVEIVAETLAASRVSERGATRLDDRASDAAMERRKKEGYF